MKRKAFLVVAGAFFLIFVGWNVYRLLYPNFYWRVECFRADGSPTGKTFIAGKEGYLARQIVDDAPKRGETCSAEIIASR
jgi:hypothetical protein